MSDYEYYDEQESVAKVEIADAMKTTAEETQRRLLQIKIENLPANNEIARVK